LIYKAIKTNLLFQENTEDELVELVDVFVPCEFKAGDVVFEQGEKGDALYVVDFGTLSLYFDQPSMERVKVGTYGDGAAFGELALIHGSPRAGSIICEVDCKLWRLHRSWYRGVVGQHRQKLEKEVTKFLSNLNVHRNKNNIIEEHFFRDIFTPAQLAALAGVVKQISFEKGDFIVRENERGDACYMIWKGEVELLLKQLGYRPILTWGSGQYFGETALLRDDIRKSTVRAKTKVTCFLLAREDFNRMVGSLEEILDYGMRPRMIRSTTVPRRSSVQLQIKDLDLFGVLGVGAFGKVKVAKAKKTGEYYALKMIGKHFIVDNSREGEVLEEIKLLKKLDNPFILHLHCAMQDEKYIYFLTDLVPCGDLKSLMETKGPFSETSTRFYSACVLLALEAIHCLSTAYRDLKPENLVLDNQGYCIVIDLGLAKKCEGHLYTFVGTPDYLAPEVIRGTGYTWGVDYWALGVLLYEFFTGRAPFASYDPTGTAKNILKGVVRFPEKGPMRELIESLLEKDQTKRLGVLKGGTEDVIKHRFYAGFDWEGLLNMKTDPPFKPTPPDNFETLGLGSDRDDARAVADWNPDL